MNLMRTSLNENGIWEHPIEEQLYDLKHPYWKFNSFPIDHSERFELIKDQGLHILGSISSGCKVLKKIIQSLIVDATIIQ